MKKLLLVFVLFTTITRSQTGCNQSGFVPIKTYSSNTTSTYGISNAVQNDKLYLCPNATVYDTTGGSSSCATVVVNPGALFVVNSYSSCLTIIALGNSTVQIKSFCGAPCLPTIIKEPSANIVNQTTLTINSTTCSAISTPTNINCTASSVNEISLTDNKIKIYPNPASGLITLEAQSAGDVRVLNVLGETIYRSAISQNKTEIDLSVISEGIYYLVFSSGSSAKTHKLVITR